MSKPSTARKPKDRDLALKRTLAPIAAQYDYVLVDCPPNLGVLTMNALIAADMLIAPIQCERLAMEAIHDLHDIVEAVRRGNPGLVIRYLRTLYDGRTRHSQEVSELLEKNLGEAVFRTIIAKTVQFPDSTNAYQPLVLWAPQSPGAEGYRNLAQEIETYAKA